MKLFNYSTLYARLDKSTRTLHITLNRPDRNNTINNEMLFELESLLAWTTSKVEIQSILFDSSTEHFSWGLDPRKLPEMSAGQLEKFSLKLHKIMYAMMQMPQTIVMDLKSGAANWAMEFALAADIRLCSVNADLRFDHTRFGLSPASGGASFLTHFVSPAFAKNWLALGNAIPHSQLLASGFISQSYDSTNREDVVQTVLKSISAQAPVQRIQTKLAIFEALRPQIEASLVQDLKIAKASRISEDWKNIKADYQEEFMPAKSMSYSVKLSLIKTDTTERPELDH
jgi:enoyl-CoA hydratase